ncbi:MAG TPA: hypothetical protein VLA37_01115 [Sphingomonadaceae bacterium]|nr:hypothetical protein [Sphingomonadaceae bacterium]
MSGDWISIVALLGWLVLAGSALAAYRLSWKKGILMALIWAAIFAGVTGFISLVT